ncbi:MAG: DNA polymerase III subunit delta [Clostridia bacterium]|nr:DNA polymerase III subunit delta [Clostridia bacterium]
MPIVEDETRVKNSVRSAVPERMYVFCGTEPYLKEHYLQTLISSCVAQGFELFNLKKFDGSQTSIREILAAADQAPLMTGRNCVVVRDFSFASINSSDCEYLKEYVARVPDSTVLVFFQNDADFPPKLSRDEAAEGEDEKGVKKQRKELFDAISKYAFIARLNKLPQQRLVNLLVNGAKRRGAALSAQNAAYMVDCCGDSLYNLMNELDKVCAFAAGGEVSRETIDRLVTKTLEATVFEITDNLFAGRVDKALTALEILLFQRTAAQMIMGTLISAFVNIYRVRLAEKARKTNADLMKDFGLSSAYYIDKLRSSSRRLTGEGIRKCLEILDEADTALKSRGGSENIVLEETIVKLGAVLR